MAVKRYKIAVGDIDAAFINTEVVNVVDLLPLKIIRTSFLRKTTLNKSGEIHRDEINIKRLNSTAIWT